MKIKDLEDKYLDFILSRCINFNKSKSLFISYIKENKQIIDKLVKKAQEKGINDIYLEEIDLNYQHELLSKLTIEEIKTHDYFQSNIWDEYAKKDASFLMAESYIPHLMDDIAEEKIAVANFQKRSTKPIYRKKQANYDIPWCIFCLPNEVWADLIFPNSKNAYEDLYLTIFKSCMIDENDPTANWNNYIEKTNAKVELLNDLEIKRLHYTNSLGTDLYVNLIPNAKWLGVGTGKEKDMLVNMPSYEIFTSPDYHKTEGIVYSSKPLNYNGTLIEDFFLEFKDGKIINYDARKGKNVLKGIIESDANSKYLGEVALVPINSPIANMNLTFYETLFDENASCHLALGDSFITIIDNYEKYSKDDLLAMGLNQSKIHVDFMIGTADLNIDAEAKDGIINIFKDGKFNI